MTEFRYFNSEWLLKYDPALTEVSDVYRNWFGAHWVEFYPSHINSLTTQLNTPWTLTKPVLTLPQSVSKQDFGSVLDTVVSNWFNSCDREVYVLWSGGIDSTCLLVAMLRTLGSQQRAQCRIVLDRQNSVKENPYFYHKFVKNNFVTVDFADFVIDHRYKDFSVVDGELGNQLMGSSVIHNMAYQGRWQELNTAWRDLDLGQYFPHSQGWAVVQQHVIDLLLESVPQSPVPIETLYDLLWWWNFNFKTDEAVYRKLVTYSEHLDHAQTRDFFYHHLWRPFGEPELMSWSLGSLNQRREQLPHSSRHSQKLYIYEFDRNDLWYHNKQEEASGNLIYTRNIFGPVFAIDQDFNKWRIDRAEHRQAIGQLLQRTQTGC